MKTRGIAMWAWLINPDSKWKDQNMWCVTLEMSKEEAKKLTDLGIKVRKEIDDDENVKYVYKFRRYVDRRDGSGKKNKRPYLVDPAAKKWEGIVGNGSDVIVLHKPYQYKFGGGGWATDLVGVQVVKLVPYVSPDKADDDPKNAPLEGFEVIGAPLKEVVRNPVPDPAENEDKEEDDDDLF